MNGALLIVDRQNHRIRRVGSDGVIQAFIGSGVEGDGTSGFGPTVDLNSPTAVTIAPDGSYYVANHYNWRVKRFDGVSLNCSVVAGNGSPGFVGDGGLATEARLNLPSSVVFDDAGDWYVLDQGNSRIRRVDRVTGIITALIGGLRGFADGSCDSALFALPGVHIGLSDKSTMEAAPGNDRIYICDTENHRIRVLDLATCFVSTIAGVGEPGWEGDGGPALSAKLNYPTDLAIAANGDMYIADTHNHAIRKIDASGVITTVAGIGVRGTSPSGIKATDAMLYEPGGVAFDDATNTLYIADTYNHQVRKVINP